MQGRVLKTARRHKAKQLAIVSVSSCLIGKTHTKDSPRAEERGGILHYAASAKSRARIGDRRHRAFVYCRGRSWLRRRSWALCHCERNHSAKAETDQTENGSALNEGAQVLGGFLFPSSNGPQTKNCRLHEILLESGFFACHCPVRVSNLFIGLIVCFMSCDNNCK